MSDFPNALGRDYQLRLQIIQYAVEEEETNPRLTKDFARDIASAEYRLRCQLEEEVLIWKKGTLKIRLPRYAGSFALQMLLGFESIGEGETFIPGSFTCSIERLDGTSEFVVKPPGAWKQQ